ncbi:MAG TPA: Mur ligase family protein [Acidimicrobiales bacterium]|nr:Mur ligase family protein [Acidimicrobiales bacterium]
MSDFTSNDSTSGFPSLGDALAWLDSHQNMERMLAGSRAERVPDLSRMAALVDALGHPERTAPVIHVTGTNGKTSTARCLTSLLTAKGLRVGTFTSPHLAQLNERIAADGEPIDDRSLLAALGLVAAVEPLIAGAGSGPSRSGPTWFEIMTAAAFVYFSDRPVDVMVLEVGMGGRWDATNVADASVSVVTNVGLDHVEFLGPTRAHVAAEKAGVIKPGSTLVLGETDPSLVPIFSAESPASLWLAEREWACYANQLAVGGRSLDLRTPGSSYEAVWLDLHGAHQGLNFAAALAAAEAFFGAPIEDRLVREAAATVSSPGRLEIVGHDPLMVLDGAKNLEGATAASAAVAEEFGADRSVVLVVGMLRGKSPEDMLRALGAPRARMVVACPAPSPRAVPAEEVAAAARALGVPSVVTADSVPDALSVASGAATADDLVLVTGSLYVVGAARAALAVGA